MTIPGTPNRPATPRKRHLCRAARPGRAWRPATPAAVRSQRGLAALTVAVALVFGMAVVALFAHRHLIFEQRSSANQARATRAFELAEAGLEWATARLNDPRAAATDCEPDSASPSFRERYLAGNAASGFAPALDALPGCRIDAAGWTCACPAPGTPPALGSRDAPGFALRFEAVDAASVRVVSTGCTALAPPCLPASAGPEADAHATVAAVLTLGPLLPVLPGAALTAVGPVRLSGVTTLANTGSADTDPATAGRLVDTGGAVEVGAAATLQGTPGSPSGAGLRADDLTLAALQPGAPDAASITFFGRAMDALPRAVPVQRIAAATPDDAGAALARLVAEGHMAFHFQGPARLPTGVHGSAERPLLLTSAHPITCAAAPCIVHGLVYGAMAAREPGDLDGLDVHGAVVSAGAHESAASLSVAFDAAILRTLRHRSAALLRVPGTWQEP